MVVALEIVVAWPFVPSRVLFCVEVPAYNKGNDIVMKGQFTVLVHDDGLFVFAGSVAPIQESGYRVGNNRDGYLFATFIAVVLFLRREHVFSPRGSFTFFSDVQGIEGLQSKCGGYFDIFIKGERVGVVGREDIPFDIFPSLETVTIVMGCRYGYIGSFFIITR